MKVYQFKMRDRMFAVDVNSGNFFEVEKITSDALNLCEKYPKDEVVNKLSRNYKPGRVKKVLKNISSLEKKGLLFAVGDCGQIKLKRKITDLTLNIVNNCNLRCCYCWNQSGAYGSVFASKKMMSPEVAFKAIDLLIRESKGARDLVVDFYGGEPLLNFGLIKGVIEYCRGIRKNNKIDFHFLLATNGTLLDKARGEFLIGNGVDVAVSLDGPKNIQDLQRPFERGKGSFDLIMSNIRSLKDEFRRRIVGRATFTPYSPDTIRTFKFLRQMGFERIEVCESEKAGYGLKASSKFFFSGKKGIKQLESIYFELADFYTDQILKGNLNYQNTYFNRFFKQLSRLYHIQSIIGSCSAGFSLMAVDIDSSIYPCTAFVGMPKFSVGSLKKGINERKAAIFLDNKISSNCVCNECWVKKICRGCGSCYNLNYFSNKNLRQPDNYYCQLFRYKTQLMMAMIARIEDKAPGLLDTVLVPEYYAARGKRAKNLN
ncbi:MAG: radical SAM protein [Candidatus Omnitrophota bacterium]